MPNDNELNGAPRAYDDNALVAALVAYGMQARAPLTINGTPAVLLPENAKLHLMPEARERPARAVTNHHFSTVGSFLDYIDNHGLNQAAVFITAATGEMIAFIDYHDRDNHPQPNWCQHRARFALTTDPRWKLWKAKDRVWMTQADFAEFIEDAAEDFVKPEAARLLEIVNTFKATKNLAFKSAQNLTNGEVNLQYAEDIQAGGGATGRVALPEIFEIGIRLFDGLDAYKLKARFRYRVPNASMPLAFSYTLIRPELSERDAIEQVVKKVETHPGLVSYRGTPSLV